MTQSTVHFATNRLLAGAPDSVSSYSAAMQPPSVSTGLIYGTAFIGGVDVASNTQGAVTSIGDISIGRFSDNAAGDLADAGRNLLIFIHGFANDFSDALTRAAFNAAWFSASGSQAAEMSVVAFSWPSLGQVIDGPVLPEAYKRDQTSARLSAQHLMTFFANLEPILTRARAQGRKTYLLAHSMGHLALQGAVESWFLHGNGPADLFDVAFLAAGDCGADAFDQPEPARLSGLSQLAPKIVIYFSGMDQVLQLSFWVNLGVRRLGQKGPEDNTDHDLFPAETYSIVDATGFDDYPRTFLTSHQYYRQSPECRADIASRL